MEYTKQTNDTNQGFEQKKAPSFNNNDSSIHTNADDMNFNHTKAQSPKSDKTNTALNTETKKNAEDFKDSDSEDYIVNVSAEQLDFPQTDQTKADNADLLSGQSQDEQEESAIRGFSGKSERYYDPEKEQAEIMEAMEEAGFTVEDSDIASDQYLADEDMDQMPVDFSGSTPESHDNNIEIGKGGTHYTKKTLFKDDQMEAEHAGEVEPLSKGKDAWHKNLTSSYCQSDKCEDEKKQFRNPDHQDSSDDFAPEFLSELKPDTQSDSDSSKNQDDKKAETTWICSCNGENNDVKAEGSDEIAEDSGCKCRIYDEKDTEKISLEDINKLTEDQDLIQCTCSSSENGEPECSCKSVLQMNVNKDDQDSSSAADQDQAADQDLTADQDLMEESVESFSEELSPSDVQNNQQNDQNTDEVNSRNSENENEPRGDEDFFDHSIEGVFASSDAPDTRFNQNQQNKSQDGNGFEMDGIIVDMETQNEQKLMNEPFSNSSQSELENKEDADQNSRPASSLHSSLY